jgi:lipoprotein-anchoring transpeptidase ErfK/SrfK
MGRIAGSITAALIAATVVTMCAAESALAGPAAALAQSETPITAGEAEKAGVQPPAPYYPPGQKFVNSGIPAPRPPDVLDTPVPSSTPTSTPTPVPPVKIEGVRTDRVPTPGQLLFDKTRAIAFDDPLNWSVTIFKKRHQLIVYYKGRLFKTYHAVFGRSFEPGTKLWEGDRRTPEGVYAIVEKHPSRRWDWFLTLNYPNEIDRYRYEQMRTGGEVPTADGRPVGVGGRIGIHGTDNPVLNRGDINWTTGCISVDDEDVEELTRLLPNGTLVIINP